jgi:hypothetical protein
MVMDGQKPVEVVEIPVTVDEDEQTVAYTASELRTKHYKQLQAIAKKRSLTADGTKEELIDRIVAAQE